MEEKTLLIVPPNDPEAVLISQIAEAAGIPMIKSAQPHGATLEKEKDVLKKIKTSGAERVVVVEMPGPKAEKKIKELGIDLVLIDHHQYTNLDRAHDEKGKELPASLTQFLKIFKLTDAKLKKLGFDSRMVRGIATMDQGFVWRALKIGYSWTEIRKLFAYSDDLMASVRDMDGEERKMKLAQKAWNRRKQFGEFFIVEETTNLGLRPRLSRIVALERKKPTSLIVVEHGRGFIYVQETDRAQDLFERFGGFTFGEHQNWGYKNEKGKKRVELDDVLAALE